MGGLGTVGPEISHCVTNSITGVDRGGPDEIAFLLGLL